MLSRGPSRDVSLADVVPSCLATLGFSSEKAHIHVPESGAIVLVLVDGLGVDNIERARAYMRFTASAMESAQSISTVFPSTTASALASFVTGTSPASHGILGYSVWDEHRQKHVNQLSGIDPVAIDRGWLARPSLIAEAAAFGHEVCVIGHPRFSKSGLTEMLYGGAKYVGYPSIESRFDWVRESVRQGRRGLFFVYISDLDEAAHSRGVFSDLWLARAEALDSCLKEFVTSVREHASVVLTADHGVIDVPVAGHLNFGLGPEMQGVLSVGGEPRCLQLKLNGQLSVTQVMDAWRSVFGDKAEILSRSDVDRRFYAGALQDATSEVANRAGDVYVLAATNHVFYDAREPASQAREMIGQHGGATNEEMKIPLFVWSQER